MQIKNSERLSYKLMSRADADLLFQLDQDVEVMRYINGGKMTSMDEIQDVYVPRMESYTNSEQGWGLWKVTVKQTGAFIGMVLVRPVDFFTDNPQLDNLELGWRFKRDSWGKGYATEAAETVKLALIDRGSVKKLSAIALEENAGSINIMKKLGMEYVKTGIHEDPLGNAEVVFYEMALSS